ncbi:uncharacterized protein LOC111685819 isoform X3 [Lucilia cuprina]|uniref:uncharacterized protein LOC111685819 isoform X3 n=1 Tax=Lucilia cuprina TaxID=7375 RepID=UPI001F057697|nr:uncharacterized protein LOC111685819 isoform X3 [Lucilia cuprina]
MSKLSFRARALDPSKQMPIYLAEELPDLPEYSAINRAVPQMPSGMEKEEESEHHLQRAICTGLIIPTPEVYTTEQDFYDRNYPPNYRMPRQLIHMQPLGLEQDVPEYDMDSEDELWINQQRKRLDLTPLKFEQMMDRLEKSSGQTVVTLNEAKALLKQDDEISIAVYDYWLNKRLKMQHPLILSVKTENRPGASSNNPYLAFRRRTEKMQTRKNRKNDETSYEKMLKLRRDLQRATTVLEMVKRREKTKREQLHLSIEIFEKRVQLKDFSGALLSELSATLKNARPAFAPLYANQYSHHSSSSGATPTAVVPSVASSAGGLNNVMGTTNLLTPGSAADGINSGSRKEKRQYKKRKHKVPRDKQQLHQQQQQQHLQQQQQYLAGIGVIPASAATGAALGGNVAGGVGGLTGTAAHPHLPHHLHHLHRQSSSPAPNESNIETEEEDLAHKIGSESEEEAPFAFRRKQGCDYLRTRTHTGNWPWEPKEDYGFGDSKYRYTLTSIKHPRPRCIGFARRRMGRGGRVLLDRVATNFDEFWSQLDYTVLETKTSDPTTNTSDATTTNKDTTKPASPPTVVDLLPPANSAANHIAGTLAVSTTNKTSVNNANTPAITIKKENSEVIDHHRNHNKAIEVEDLLNKEQKLEDSDDLEECDYEYSEDENDLEDEFGVHIQRDRSYHSCVSMARKRRRRRRQQLQQMEKTKRRKINSTIQQKNMELVTRKLLYKLSQSLAVAEGVSPNERVNNLLNHTSVALSTEIKQEKLNGLNKEDQCLINAPINWPNHRCSSTVVTADNNKLINNSSFISSFSSSTAATMASACANVIVVGNTNNNNSSSNVNKNISNGSRRSSCSLSDKTNVIKTEVHDVDNDETTNISRPSSAATGAGGDSMTRVIKQELIDSSAASLGSADDSNEPLSSIQKLSTTAAADMMEDEENVNLAELSNLIKIKKEVVDEADRELMRKSSRHLQTSSRPGSDDDEVSCFNQMADVIRVKNLKKHRSTPCSNSEALKVFNALNVDNDDELSMLGGLSPTSSQRLDICNELLSEIRRDWLHFRPKTPTETEKEEESYWGLNMDYKLSSPLVEWSQHTPIAVEMVREPLENEEEIQKSSASRLWKTDSDDAKSAFISSAFKYDDLEADTQLLQNSYLSDLTRGSSKSPETNNSAACLDLNFSGDSLNDINLLGDGDDADMLDNILQEVQIDDIKTLNQATNFWNGILDGENVDAEVDGDVEVAAGLLDSIDDTKKGDRSMGDKKVAKLKGGKKSCALLAPVGSSTFNCSPLEKENITDETFFKKEEPKKEPEEVEPEVAIKSEPMEVTETKTNVAVSVNNPRVTNVQQPQLAPMAPLIMNSFVNTDNMNSHRELLQMVQQQQQIQQSAPTTNTPMIITQTIQQQQQHVHQPQLQPQQHQQQQQQHLIAHSTPVQVIGNTISLNQNESLVVQQSQQQQQQQQQHHQLQTTTTTNHPAAVLHAAQPQQAQQQLTTIQVLQQPNTQQIRNVTVQQLHQLQLQQQQQRKLQLQQQQQKLLLQRDLVNTSAASVIAQYVPTSSATTAATIMRQPTLTPIGASSVNNAGGQMIYTTSSGDVITAGSQKIYLQKAPVSVTSGTQGVNIINTSSGQQLTVQNIAGVQHISSATGGNGSTSTGPLIVTTSARNAVQQLSQQQQQQLVGQATQQIVWRQIGSTNVTTNPAGMLTGTANTDGTVAGTGNKIVWTSRPAQKRQLNGPESTDINKLLLNRKFSQRKIVQQQPQLLQQQQQQQQQTQDDELSGVNVTISGQDTTTTTAVTYNTQHQQQHHQQQQQQQQQIQKLPGGKVIKMPSFPLLVSEVNLQQHQQQQQQQQQKHNTAAAIAANHNYSLQPTAIITSQASQQGNKIYLTTSSSGGAATNFTITNASELQTAAQKLQQTNNSNLKLNFVATNPQQQQQLQQQAQQQQQQQQQTVVLNKANIQQQQQILPQQLLQQTGKLKRERILNIIGAAQVDNNTNSATGLGTVTATSVGSNTGDNNKRVLYTSLLNVKPLQKNNAGQMQVQIGPQGMTHAVLRSRIANNQAIFANMRTVPVATVSAASNNSHNNTTSAGAGTTTLQVVSQSTQLNANQITSNTSNPLGVTLNALSNNNNNNNNSDGSLHMQQQQHSSSSLAGDINSSSNSLTNISHSVNDLKSANNVLNMENSSTVVSSLNNTNSTATVNSSSSANGSSANNNNTTTLMANTNNIQNTNTNNSNNNNNNNSNTTTINR